MRGRALSGLGPISCPYSPECVEGEFCELRRHGVLRSSFGGGFFPASQRIRVCSLRECRGSLRHATMLFDKRAKSSRRWGGLGLSWYLEALKKYAVFSG